MKLQVAILLCCSYAFVQGYTPVMNIGPMNYLYGPAASLVVGTYDAVFDLTALTDPTILLQTALNTLGLNGGGTLNVIAGLYEIQGNIEIPSATHLKGAGLDVTTFKLLDFATPFKYAGIFRASDLYDIMISHLTIDGNNANQAQDPISVYGRYGIYIEGSQNVWFDYVHVTQNTHYGFDPHGDKGNMIWGNTLTITNCISDGNGWDGFTLDQTFHIVALNNLAINNGRHGFNIVTGSANVLIANNTMINNGYNFEPQTSGGCGIEIQNNQNFFTHDAHVLTNTITSNKRAGVCLDTVPNITVTGNIIRDHCLCFHFTNEEYVWVNDNLCQTKKLAELITTTAEMNPPLGEAQTEAIVYFNNNEFIVSSTCPATMPDSHLNNQYIVGYNNTNATFIIYNWFDAVMVIQSAVDTISANGGGIVHINEGTYIINGTLLLHDFVHVQGSGMDVTILQLIDDADPFVVGFAGFVRVRLSNNVTVSDLTLDGNRMAQCCTSDCIYGRTGLFVEGSTNFVASNVKTTGFQISGIDVHGWDNGPVWGVNAKIAYCESTNNDHYGASFNQMYNVSIMSSKIYQNGGHGISANNTQFFDSEENSVISNGYLDEGCGIIISNNPSFPINRNVIYNNFVGNSKKAGICMVDAFNVDIMDNVINDSCICFDFADVGGNIFVEENSCSGNKLISLLTFVLENDNSFVVKKCSNMSTMEVNGCAVADDSSDSSDFSAASSTDTVSSAGSVTTSSGTPGSSSDASSAGSVTTSSGTPGSSSGASSAGSVTTSSGTSGSSSGASSAGSVTASSGTPGSSSAASSTGSVTTSSGTPVSSSAASSAGSVTSSSGTPVSSSAASSSGSVTSSSGTPVSSSAASSTGTVSSTGSVTSSSGTPVSSSAASSTGTPVLPTGSVRSSSGSPVSSSTKSSTGSVTSSSGTHASSSAKSSTGSVTSSSGTHASSSAKSSTGSVTSSSGTHLSSGTPVSSSTKSSTASHVSSSAKSSTGSVTSSSGSHSSSTSHVSSSSTAGIHSSSGSVAASSTCTDHDHGNHPEPGPSHSEGHSSDGHSEDHNDGPPPRPNHGYQNGFKLQAIEEMKTNNAKLTKLNTFLTLSLILVPRVLKIEID
ncbi:MAG: hypothetical protein Harvfovirus1_38 [Harvfovirus sp.]|uniref:Right handed beta helix domain-containing protein n=1 Tax=Harvfovirus sp. TaxID=2487768 RepID=A0A3G5A3K7_9VIRU|nr:MAG: hypothetical protein Harvfovirus1_38 [Harvfovirus sp.]